jgi:LmbE family N-acetylglucosaminyl deacetylase
MAFVSDAICAAFVGAQQSVGCACVLSREDHTLHIEDVRVVRRARNGASSAAHRRLDRNMTDGTYVPRKVMAIFAHPDDIEFECAGTAARWAKAGAEVFYVLCTSGDGGIADHRITRAEAAQIREAEQRAAAAVVGVKEVVFLREPDGLLENTLALRKRLVREIRRIRPEVVLTGDPTLVLTANNFINHPDHRAASNAAIDAVYPTAGQPHLFEDLREEGLWAHRVRKVYITGDLKSESFVDITDTIDMKVEAVRQHASQFPREDPGQRVRDWAALVGKRKEVPYAEPFRVLTLLSDAEFERISHLGNG